MSNTSWHSSIPGCLTVILVVGCALSAVAAGEKNLTDLNGDPLPKGAVARLGTTRFRHASQVASVAYSRNGRLVATGGYDPFVRVWESSSGKEMLRLPLGGRHSTNERWVAFAPDDTVVAAATSDVFCLWDTANGQVRLQRKLPKGETARSLAFAADGRSLAVLSWRPAGIGPQTESVLRIWDIGKGIEVDPLRLPRGYTRSVAYSADGRLLAVGQDDAIHLCDPHNGKKVHTLPRGRALYSCVAFSTLGVLAAPGKDDKTIELWDAGTGASKQLLCGHDKCVTALSFSANGKRLVSAGADSTVRVWDADSGKAVLIQRVWPLVGARCVALAPDGDTVAAGSLNSVYALSRWDVASGKEVSGPRGQTTGVQLVGWTSSGNVVTAGRGGHNIHLWQPNDGKPLTGLPEASSIDFAAISPDGKTVAIVSQDGPVYLRDLGGAKKKVSLAGEAGTIGSLAFAPRGETVAVGYCQLTKGYICTIILWDVATGKRGREIRVPGKSINALVFSPDGKKLVSTSAGLRVWDPETGALIGEFPRAEQVFGLRFSPHGKLLAAPSYPKGFSVWNTDTREYVGRFDDDGPAVRSVAFSSSARLLACGKDDGSIGLWEVKTWRFVGKAQGPVGRVYALHFSADDRLLISGHEDTTGLVWDVASLQVSTREK